MLNITVTWHGCPYNILYNKAIKSFVVANYNFFEMSDLSIVIYFKTLRIAISTPLSTLYNSLILKGLKFNNFLAKNCKPSIYRALEKRVESQVISIKSIILEDTYVISINPNQIRSP